VNGPDFCPFSFHLPLYDQPAHNTLWIVPGSGSLGRVDVAKWPKIGASDRLVGAVPILAKPRDVYIQNRLCLHGAFANTSPDSRVTLALGFNRKDAVLGCKTQGYQSVGINAQPRAVVEYDEAWIRERSKMIQWAIDARRQRYPEETPYSYTPFRGEEEKFRWSPKLKANHYGKYWEKHLVI